LDLKNFIFFIEAMVMALIEFEVFKVAWRDSLQNYPLD